MQGKYTRQIKKRQEKLIEGKMLPFKPNSILYNIETEVNFRQYFIRSKDKKLRMQNFMPLTQFHTLWISMM